jgi:4'-phosphopantetheinyl transferase
MSSINGHAEKKVPMGVYWLEQNQTDLPAGLDWLSTRETDRYNTFQFAKRRSDWLLGRWTGKLAVATHLGFCFESTVLRRIEIVAAPSGAPEVFVAGKLLDIAISLSHSADRAACALSGAGRALGCDLEQIQERSSAFVTDYFTADEQALVGSVTNSEKWPLVALLWSAKESALKALRAGLRLDTRCVRVMVEWYAVRPPNAGGDWLPLRVGYTRGELFRGWWRESEQFVQTLVADPAPDSPIQYLVPGTQYRVAVTARR